MSYTAVQEKCRQNGLHCSRGGVQIGLATLQYRRSADRMDYTVVGEECI